MEANPYKVITEIYENYIVTFFQDHVMEVIEMAEVAYEICQQSRDVDLTDNLGTDFINQWVSFYDAPDKFVGDVFQFLVPSISPDNAEFIQNVYNQKNFNESLTTRLINAYSNQEPDLLIDFKEYLPDNIEDNVSDSLPDKFFEVCKKEPKLLFYFKVWFPCFVEYAEFLPAIMERAIKGDHTALENLIRLDPCILSHPKIQTEYHKTRFKNPTFFDYLCKVQQGKGLRELTATNVKYLFGAYIYRQLNTMDSQMQLFTDQYGLQLPKMSISVEEILKMFNQHAKKKSGKLYDSDFDSVSAFKAGVSRYQSFWDNYLP